MGELLKGAFLAIAIGAFWLSFGKIVRHQRQDVIAAIWLFVCAMGATVLALDLTGRLSEGPMW